MLLKLINMNFPKIIAYNGHKIPLRLRYNTKAKRIILRVDQETGGAIITLPPHSSKTEALSLVNERVDWIVDKIKGLPPKITLTDGQSLTLMGQLITIRHRPDLKMGVQLIGSEMITSGKIEHLHRRIVDWLKKYTKEIIAPRAHNMASQLECKINRISIRDTKSRWGSCSSQGNLSFCWRLIMTPEWVLNYVIAHEVSHLKHMDHGPEFWQIVGTFGVKPKQARIWLNQHGRVLQRIR